MGKPSKFRTKLRRSPIPGTTRKYAVNYEACYVAFADDPEDKDPMTGRGKRKSMYDYVDEQLMYNSPGTVLRKTSALFGCSRGPVESTIAVVRDAWAEQMKLPRTQRINQSLKQLDDVAAHARRLALQPMRDSPGALLGVVAKTVLAKAKFTGDTAPDVIIALGAMTADEALKKAAEMRALAEEVED